MLILLSSRYEYVNLRRIDCHLVPNSAYTDVNGGQKILLRLRPASAPDTFYDEEDIIHTMLHEVGLLPSLCVVWKLMSRTSS